GIAAGTTITSIAGPSSIVLSQNATASGNGVLLAFGAGGAITLAAANSYTGSTFVNGGTLNIANVAAVGNIAGFGNAFQPGTVFLTSGTVQTSLTGGFAFLNPITFNNASVTLAGSNPLSFLGAGTLAGVAGAFSG